MPAKGGVSIRAHYRVGDAITQELGEVGEGVWKQRTLQPAMPDELTASEGRHSSPGGMKHQRLMPRSPPKALDRGVMPD